jgi:hypothetical protein
MTIDTFRVCTQDLLNCADAGDTLLTDVNTPLTITWDSSGTDICTAVTGPGFGTGDATDGTDTTDLFASALGETMTTYRIACTMGSAIPVEEIVYVSTNAALPTLSTSATVVRAGDTVRLNWNSNSALESACTLSGPGVSTSDLTNGTGDDTSGYVDVNINGRSTYTFSCPSGTAVKTVEIVPSTWE